MSEINFHLGDCMKHLKSYDDNQFDWAIVDPPYGLGATKMTMGQNLNRGGKKRTESTAVKIRNAHLGGGELKDRSINKFGIDWDSETPPAEYFEELFRVSKNQIIWGGNYFDLPPTRGIIAWDKKQPWDSFSQWEMAWTSTDKPAKLYSISNTGGANIEPKIHPTQKPVELYRRVINDYTKRGDSIIDTHLGSASIAIACSDLGRNLEGIEINDKYLSDAQKRFLKATAQIKLAI